MGTPANSASASLFSSAHNPRTCVFARGQVKNAKKSTIVSVTPGMSPQSIQRGQNFSGTDPKMSVFALLKVCVVKLFFFHSVRYFVLTYTRDYSCRFKISHDRLKCGKRLGFVYTKRILQDCLWLAISRYYKYHAEKRNFNAMWDFEW